MTPSIEAILQHIKESDNHKPRKNIAVLGAGMAGLVAAYELSMLGHAVTLYEASDRIGGRVWTRRFEDGQYHELGAMRIPDDHLYTRYYIKRCGLQLRRFINTNDQENAFYHIRGIKTTRKTYVRDLLPAFDLSPSELEIAREHPSRFMSIALKGFIESIRSSQLHTAAITGTGPLTEYVSLCDKINMQAFLQQHIISKEALDLFTSTSLYNTLWESSLLGTARNAVISATPDPGANPYDEIAGGMDLLPQALYSLLKNRVIVKLNHEIIHIDNGGPVPELGITNRSSGDCNTYTAKYDHVICTLPFTVLRRIRLKHLSSAKMSAIRNMNYASAAKVLVNCKTRFWEKNNGIIGGASITDQLPGAIYYPSDNYHPASKITGIYGIRGLFTSYTTGNFNMIDPGISDGPGVMVGSYCWGQDAKRLGALRKKDREELVLRQMADIHPEILEPGMVKETDSMFWDEYKWSAGAYGHMVPGDFITYYQNGVSGEKNLHFAGEHLSFYQAWIQGAIVSSLNAVRELVSS